MHENLRMRPTVRVLGEGDWDLEDIVTRLFSREDAAVKTALGDIIRCAGCDPNFSKAFLSRLSLNSLFKYFTSTSDEDIMELAASAVTNLSGPLARGPTTKTYLVDEKYRFSLTEPDFVSADVGWCTWPSALLVARHVLLGNLQVAGPRIIEIGCGTGAFGISLALSHLGKGALPSTPANDRPTIVLTDFLDSIVDTASQNASLNGCADFVSVQKLDWRDVITAAEERDRGSTSTSSSPPSEGVLRAGLLLGTFDDVIVADCIYEPDHPALVAKCASLLMKPVSGRLSAMVPLGDRRPHVARLDAGLIAAGLDVSDVTVLEGDTFFAGDVGTTFALYKCGWQGVSKDR